MAWLVIRDPINDQAEKRANQMAKALKIHIREKALGVTELFGPVPPFFSRIDGRYQWQISIRSPDPVRLLEDFQIPPNWVIDIDPVSTL